MERPVEVYFIPGAQLFEPGRQVATKNDAIQMRETPPDWITARDSICMAQERAVGIFQRQAQHVARLVGRRRIVGRFERQPHAASRHGAIFNDLGPAPESRARPTHLDPFHSYTHFHWEKPCLSLKTRKKINNTIVSMLCDQRQLKLPPNDN